MNENKKDFAIEPNPSYDPSDPIVQYSLTSSFFKDLTETKAGFEHSKRYVYFQEALFPNGKFPSEALNGGTVEQQGINFSVVFLFTRQDYQEGHSEFFHYCLIEAGIDPGDISIETPPSRCVSKICVREMDLHTITLALCISFAFQHSQPDALAAEFRVNIPSLDFNLRFVEREFPGFGKTFFDKI